MSPNGLTSRQEAFVREYLKDGNATGAAVRAGFAPGPGAAVTGSRLLRNPKVSLAIQEGQRQTVEAAKLTRERVLEELAAIGFDTSLRPRDRIQALMGVAKLAGWLVEQAHVTFGLEQVRALAERDAIDPDAVEAEYVRVLAELEAGI